MSCFRNIMPTKLAGVFSTPIKHCACFTWTDNLITGHTTMRKYDAMGKLKKSRHGGMKFML